MMNNTSSRNRLSDPPLMVSKNGGLIITRKQIAIPRMPSASAKSIAHFFSVQSPNATTPFSANKDMMLNPIRDNGRSASNPYIDKLNSIPKNPNIKAIGTMPPNIKNIHVNTFIQVGNKLRLLTRLVST